MHIERIQVEEGFLEGLDITLVPGLNVLIGARGTGKTSVLELIRFCLDVQGYTAESGKKSREHALSVLGKGGQVTLTLSDGARKVTVTRSAGDEPPRASAPFDMPIMFSQTEIENVGMQPGGRLRLLDSFAGVRQQLLIQENEAAATVRSLTAEAETLRREIDEFSRQIEEIAAIEAQLVELAPAEQGLAKLSAEAGEKKKAVDAIGATIASAAVAANAVERFSEGTKRWHAALAAASKAAPALEAWPAGGGDDRLAIARTQVSRAHASIQGALDELARAEAETGVLLRRTTDEKLVAEEQARQLRKDIEGLQAGAGAIARQGQQLRERKAQLESLRAVAAERNGALEALLKQRDTALDQLDSIREQRYQARVDTAGKLNTTLGPRIHIVVTRSGQFETLAAAISTILRGSGLHYNDLALALAQRVSPRELLEATDGNDFELIADATGISKDRALRVLAQLKDADLGMLATVAVEDLVEFQLLDGIQYKDISTLSIGQRCTVILPLALRHVDKLLIVDQPEDHIDNAFIADTLILSLLARDPCGQIIFSTHNANIPVLGKADRVIQLGSDGRRGHCLEAGTLDAPPIVTAISAIMEGGAEAFMQRASFYSRHVAHDPR